MNSETIKYHLNSLPDITLILLALIIMELLWFSIVWGGFGSESAKTTMYCTLPESSTGDFSGTD